ncbi:ABC transporter ATP-binding protein [bacterium]|nr:MAG: ABC transporter ATP-binding protein [bacterium]
MAEISLRIDRVEKSFSSDFLRRRQKVLRGISLQVHRGETFAFLGQNGAGKTTTIKALLGLIRVDAGHLELLGHQPGDRRALARIGYLPENPYFYDHLTGRELLGLMADLHGLGKQLARRRVEEILELVGMRDNASRRMRTYSKGMLQRIGLGQALINDPALLILDEPMGGLDPIGRHHVRAIISELKARGKTIFLSSHILSDVEAVADRASILRDGEIRRLIDLNVDERSFRRMEMQCRGLTEADIQLLRSQGFGVDARNDVAWVRITEASMVSEAVLAVQRTAGQILQLGPVRTSLEEVFMQEAGEGGPSGPPANQHQQVRDQVRHILDQIDEYQGEHQDETRDEMTMEPRS